MAFFVSLAGPNCSMFNFQRAKIFRRIPYHYLFSDKLIEQFKTAEGIINAALVSLPIWLLVVLIKRILRSSAAGLPLL
jgi:hypothetical protein